jgi:hypothetical protein
MLASAALAAAPRYPDQDRSGQIRLTHDVQDQDIITWDTVGCCMRAWFAGSGWATSHWMGY